MIDTEETDQLPSKRKNLQPKWKHAPSQADLDNDYKSAESGQSEFRVKLLEWEETRNGGKAINVKGFGKSAHRPKIVRKQNEWKYPSLEEPFLSTQKLYRVSPATAKDVLGAQQNERVLNYQWNAKVQKTRVVNDIVRTVVDEGTVIVKTGWEVETAIEEVEEQQPIYASPEKSLMLMQQAVHAGSMSQEQAAAMMETGEPMQIGFETVTVEKEVLVKNQPTYEVCINANVTIDPTSDGVAEDAMFVIHEYDTSYAELKSDEFIKDEDGNEYGIYHNLDFIVYETNEVEDPAKSFGSNNFEFKDKARRRMRAYEYWGYWDIQGDGELVSIVATWVGKTLIRLEENPFPHGRLPFSIATYMPVKKDVHGEPDAELLKENQDAIGNMTRAILDTTAKLAVGQEFIDENFFPSPSVKNQYEKGNTVYYRSGFNPKTAIHKNDVQQVGSTPFDVINWQTADANELTGTRPFGGPGGPKLGGNQQERDSMDATAKRELSILRRLSAMFVDMAKMTIAMNQVFLSPEEVVRITDKEFVTVKRDDLQGDFDLRIQVSTPEKDADQAEKLMKLLQTNAQSMPEPIKNMHYIKLAELWGHDDLADSVKEYKPEPNPTQQKLEELAIKKAELENAILMKELEDVESKIAERLSRTERNSQAEVALANAKAKQALATADKISSETDILDQSFLEIQSGVKRQQDIEDQQFKANVDAAKDAKKSDLEMAKEQFKRAGLNVPAKVVNSI